MPTIGIDYGARRIGIAVSESDLLAEPHSVMRNAGDVVAAIAALGEEIGADRFVVGLPKRRHGSAGEKPYRDFAGRLRQRTCKEVVLWDETLSTVEAADRMRSAGRRRRDAQRDIDMHAAAVMLQSFLDARRPR